VFAVGIHESHLVQRMFSLLSCELSLETC
jgi:hypothetical protein